MKYPITIEGKYIRQSSSWDSFAIIKLKIEPFTSSNKSIIFENKLERIDLGTDEISYLDLNSLQYLDYSQTICSGVILGIKVVFDKLKIQNIAISNIKIIALEATFHPVDSHARAFEKATESALLKTFQQVQDLHKSP